MFSESKFAILELAIGEIKGALDISCQFSSQHYAARLKK